MNVLIDTVYVPHNSLKIAKIPQYGLKRCQCMNAFCLLLERTAAEATDLVTLATICTERNGYWKMFKMKYLSVVSRLAIL